MTKTIAQLWYGNIGPINSLGYNNDQMKDLEDTNERIAEKIRKLLAEEGKELFEKYCDNMNKYLLVSSEQAFCDGYCIGTKITAEAFAAADDLIGS